MRCPQFSVKALLWLMVVVAAFLGGIVAGQRLERRRMHDEAEYFAGWQQHLLEAKFQVQDDLRRLKKARERKRGD